MQEFLKGKKENLSQVINKHNDNNLSEAIGGSMVENMRKIQKEI